VLLLHHAESLDRLIGWLMVINMRMMISQHSRLLFKLLVSIVSLGSYEIIVVVVITLFCYSIHVVNSLVILILPTIDRR